MRKRALSRIRDPAVEHGDQAPQSQGHKQRCTVRLPIWVLKRRTQSDAQRAQACKQAARLCGSAAESWRQAWQAGLLAGPAAKESEVPREQADGPSDASDTHLLAEQASRLLVSTFAARAITATDPDQPSPTHEH